MIGRWWWSQQDKQNKMHWLSWDKLTRPKKEGGLGFRDLHLFNMAMLARQGWRILNNPDSLCAQILKAKYFPNTTIMECVERDGISYSWRSILRGVDLLKKGLIWRVGNGESINIWSDSWLPNGLTRKPVIPRGPSLLTSVSELINPVNGEWDTELVEDTFWQQDVDLILAMPVDVAQDDWHAWHYDGSLPKWQTRIMMDIEMHRARAWHMWKPKILTGTSCGKQQAQTS